MPYLQDLAEQPFHPLHVWTFLPRELSRRHLMSDRRRPNNFDSQGLEQNEVIERKNHFLQQTIPVKTYYSDLENAKNKFDVISEYLGKSKISIFDKKTNAGDQPLNG